MLKIKYLHRSSRKGNDYDWYGKKKHREKNANLLYDDLPFHGKMGKGWSNYDFTPLTEFIESKIGENWNDVYSELLTKVKKRFRYCLEKGIGTNGWRSWIINRPIYDENFIPRDNYGRILSDAIYIDINNIVTRKTEEEILKDSKKFIRKRKIQEILERQKIDQDLEENTDLIF